MVSWKMFYNMQVKNVVDLGFEPGTVFQIGVGHRPLADKKWKWPIFSEWSGQNGLSKLENPAQMADHFCGIPAKASDTL